MIFKYNKSLKPTVTRVTPFAAKANPDATLRRLNSTVLRTIIIEGNK